MKYRRATSLAADAPKIPVASGSKSGQGGGSEMADATLTIHEAPVGVCVTSTAGGSSTGPPVAISATYDGHRGSGVGVLASVGVCTVILFSVVFCVCTARLGGGGVGLLSGGVGYAVWGFVVRSAA